MSWLRRNQVPRELRHLEQEVRAEVARGLAAGALDGGTGAAIDAWIDAEVAVATGRDAESANRKRTLTRSRLEAKRRTLRPRIAAEVAEHETALATGRVNGHEDRRLVAESINEAETAKFADGQRNPNAGTAPRAPRRATAIGSRWVHGPWVPLVLLLVLGAGSIAEVMGFEVTLEPVLPGKTQAELWIMAVSVTVMANLGWAFFGAGARTVNDRHPGHHRLIVGAGAVAVLALGAIAFAIRALANIESTVDGWIWSALFLAIFLVAGLAAAGLGWRYADPAEREFVVDRLHRRTTAWRLGHHQWRDRRRQQAIVRLGSSLEGLDNAQLIRQQTLAQYGEAVKQRARYDMAVGQGDPAATSELMWIPARTQPEPNNPLAKSVDPKETK
jgi:hypothetical protein